MFVPGKAKHSEPVPVAITLHASVTPPAKPTVVPAALVVLSTAVVTHDTQSIAKCVVLVLIGRINNEMCD